MRSRSRSVHSETIVKKNPEEIRGLNDRSKSRERQQPVNNEVQQDNQPETNGQQVREPSQEQVAKQ